MPETESISLGRDFEAERWKIISWEWSKLKKEKATRINPANEGLEAEGRKIIQWKD